MTLPVVRLEPHSQWDQNMLNLLFTDLLIAPTWLQFTEHDRHFDELGEEPFDGCVLIIPGRYWHDRYDEITAYVAQFQWVLAVRTGDEQDLFDIDRIRHPNIRWWVQTPSVRRTYGDVRKFGVGYTPHFSNLVGVKPPDIGVDVFLSAQNTHPRRFAAFANMNCMPGVMKVSHETPGFTQGLAPELYCEYMIHSRVALCPAGPDTPDTFRLYEALQAHTVPIADDVAANSDTTGYWRTIFPDAPFPIITDWNDTPGLVPRLIADYPRNANRIAAWWMREKRNYTRWLNGDLAALGVPFNPWPELVTVIIPVSPIPSHPSIDVLDQTIHSVRFWKPHAEIILTFDGVRAEQEDMRVDYEEFIRRILWKCDHYWSNVTPLVFDEHMHQSGMMRAALERVQTPLLMYVEQDTPLVIDEPIDWKLIQNALIDGHADLVRFHHEAQVLDVHMHLMSERVGKFWRTTQWSQRPHVATKQFYLNAMQHLSSDAKCFLEEKFASTAQQQIYWKLFMYVPNDTNIKRSYHTDGRAGGPKFEDTQVF